MTLWHVTMKKNLESILQHGLIPKIGELAADCGEKDSRVYLFPDINAMHTALSSWLGEWYESRYGENVELCSLKVTPPEGFPIYDGGVGYERYSYDTIPAGCISYYRDE